jgi:hypothetical protein
MCLFGKRHLEFSVFFYASIRRGCIAYGGRTRRREKGMASAGRGSGPGPLAFAT